MSVAASAPGAPAGSGPITESAWRLGSSSPSSWSSSSCESSSGMCRLYPLRAQSQHVIGTRAYSGPTTPAHRHGTAKNVACPCQERAESVGCGARGGEPRAAFLCSADACQRGRAARAAALLEVLLVVILRLVERLGRLDVRHDRRGPVRLLLRLRAQRSLLLFPIVEEHDRPVLIADVPPLPVQLRRNHPERRVRLLVDRLCARRRKEGRPSTAGVVLRLRAEKLCAAAGTAIGARLEDVVVFTRERRLRPLLTQDVELLRGQLGAPLSLGLLDFRHHTPSIASSIQSCSPAVHYASEGYRPGTQRPIRGLRGGAEMKEAVILMRFLRHDPVGQRFGVAVLVFAWLAVAWTSITFAAAVPLLLAVSEVVRRRREEAPARYPVDDLEDLY